MSVAPRRCCCHHNYFHCKGMSTTLNHGSGFVLSIFSSIPLYVLFSFFFCFVFRMDQQQHELTATMLEDDFFLPFNPFDDVVDEQQPNNYFTPTIRSGSPQPILPSVFIPSTGCWLASTDGIKTGKRWKKKTPFNPPFFPPLFFFFLLVHWYPTARFERREEEEEERKEEEEQKDEQGLIFNHLKNIYTIVIFFLVNF